MVVSSLRQIKLHMAQSSHPMSVPVPLQVVFNDWNGPGQAKHEELDFHPQCGVYQCFGSGLLSFIEGMDGGSDP